MNDDNHETRDEYEDRKEQHEAASEIEAFRASCVHQRVIYRPVGGNAGGWRPVWVCEHCCAEFVPESQVRLAVHAADLRGAQLLMVGSQLADDPKMDHRDRADPRWTPTLHEAWVQREENKRLLSSVEGYRRDIDNCLAELKHKNKVLRDREREPAPQPGARELYAAWAQGAEAAICTFASDERPPSGPEVDRFYAKNPYENRPSTPKGRRSKMNDDNHETHDDYLTRWEEHEYAWIQIGTIVDYHAIIGGPITKAAMVVREPAQQLPGGQWVCWLRGKAGCVSCDSVTPVAP